MEREMRRGLAALMGVAALLGSAGAARAVDGVIEINDASIVAAGGYPAVIGAPGSYVLTGNLTPPPGVNGIDIFGPDVTLDLNGFAISGGGGGTGINAFSPGLTVRNGAVTGFGLVGISTAFGAKIIELHLTGNGTAIVSGGCVIVESTIISNGTGISANRCKIENNIIEANGGIGVFGGANVVVNNQISDNGAGGILTFGGSTIQDNVILANGGFGVTDGIFGPPPPPPPVGVERVNIRGNTIHGNGGAAGGPGISFTMPVLISENTVSNNTGSGIVCGPGCTVNENLIDSNNTLGLPASGGAIVGDGANVTDNAISFNTGFGLNLPATSGYSQNTLTFNAGPDMLLAPVFGPHPTSGFLNLCSGIPGPAPSCP